MAHEKVSRLEAAPADPPVNPHCAKTWPYDACDNGHIATATNAVYGAAILADLLLADDAIAEGRRDADDPEAEPLPFKTTVRYGLGCALRACLDAADTSLQFMRDHPTRV